MTFLTCPEDFHADRSLANPSMAVILLEVERDIEQDVPTKAR